MNILIVANHYVVCSARYAADAFQRLGHTVRHVGRPMGRDIWGIQVPQEYVWEPDETLAEINGRGELGRHDLRQTDLVIVMDSDPALLEWDRFRYYTSFEWGGDSRPPIVVYGVDNHVRNYRRPHFDHYFLAHKSVSLVPWGFEVGDEINVDVYDNEDMTWLPCATDPIAFPPSPIPWAERAYDVCMIGVMYERRWQLVNALRAAGLKVLAGTGLVYEAYRDAYHNSRVALVSSFDGDLPIRLFEGAGMGCAVLHDPIADLADLTPPRHPFFQEYRSVEMAVQLAREASDVRDDRAAERNVQWAQQHTWDARAQVIIDWLEGRHGTV